MAMKITDECIDCAACVDGCDNDAIQESDENNDHYWIEGSRCTECSDKPSQQCIELCPVECIIKAA